MTQNGIVRVAALADIHCRSTAAGTLQPLFSQINASADVLLLGGDLTDRGLADEAHVLAKELAAAVKIPIVAVLGNHDFESGLEGEVSKILADAGVCMLDGEACEIAGVGFAGVKGFGGGFGSRTLQAWGEGTVKVFVREAVEEALKLESALAKLRTEGRVVLLHYAPVKDTVQGEPPEIYPFLGSSRLEEPLTRFAVSAVIHGHAHAGSPEGRALGNIPVYNVAMAVLGSNFRDRPPFRVIEIPLHPDLTDDRFQHESSYSVLADVDR
jgi:Icc-related predicted phosphoesterase